MKKEILFPIIIIVLGLIFVIISILVYFSKGNPRFIKKKLKIGALIISLTGIIACGTSSTQKTTCYVDSIENKTKDSIAEAKKLDSIETAEKQKRIDDSIAIVKEEKRKKDSIAKIKKKKKPTPVCYRPVKKTCYAPIKNNSIKR